MKFDIEKTRLDLDRFATWWHLKYDHSDQHICDGCDTSCGCLWNEGESISNRKILEVWEKFVDSRINAETKISKAKQAYWAILEFDQVFGEYHWMNWDHFEGEVNHYFLWKHYLKTYLNFQEGELETWDINDSGEMVIVWEKPLEGAWYKTAETHLKTQPQKLLSCEDIGI